MRETIRIVIPETHPSINTWKNWHFHKYNSEKKRWKEMIKTITLDTTGGKRIFGKVKVEIEYVFSTRHRHDFDNYAPKFILDGLTEVLLDDDNSDVITSLTMKFSYEKGNPRTIVTIKGE